MSDPKRHLDYTNRPSVLERRRMLMRESGRELILVFGAFALLLFAAMVYAVFIHQC